MIDALARRRLASDGGAYTLLLDPGPARDGPLAGVPLAVKDLIDVSGVPTRCGSRVRRDAPPAERDAPVVAALRRAGAAIVGKTALHEFAFGATGLNDFEGTPRHPSDPARIPGGSSSGSAVAVAEGSAAIALGTDTGGSVRIPAALCGVVGFKPSYGMLSVEGVFPLAPSLDHVGLFARDVATVRQTLAALVPLAGAAPPTRFGVDRRALESAEAAVARAIEDALRGLAAKEVKLPDEELVFATSTVLLYAEATHVHRETLRTRRADYFSVERFVVGSAIDAPTYVAAQERRRELRARMEEILRDVDVVVGPTVGFVAPTLDETRHDPDMSLRLVRHTRLANVTGLPALSLPLPVHGLPVGLQILAADDATALGAAASFERRLAT